MAAASTLINKFVMYVINPAILVIFAFGFLIFMWGLFQFMMNLDNQSERANGARHMLYGIIGILIMVSVKSIIAILDNTFDLGAMSGSIDVNRLNNINTTGSFFQ